MGLVDKDKIADALAHGEASQCEKTRDMTIVLKTGKFVRRRDGARIPPQPGHGCMQYFWYLHSLEGPHAAYDWLMTIPDLQWFRKAWDEGRGKRQDGSTLAPLVHKTQTALSDGEFAKAKARKKARAERDRESRNKMKGASGQGGGKKAHRK